MPQKILEQPDQAAYHKGQVELDEKYDQFTSKIKELSDRFNEKLKSLREGVRGSESNETKAAFEDLKEKSQKKRDIYDVVNAINKELETLETRKAKAEKRLHPVYNKLDTLTKGIKKLEHDLQVASLTANQEKAMLKEIQQIKDSKPFIEELERIREDIFNKKKEKFEAGAGLGELKEETKSLKDTIGKVKKGKEDKKTFKEKVQKELDKINEDRNKFRNDILSVREEKEKHRELYYK